MDQKILIAGFISVSILLGCGKAKQAEPETPVKDTTKQETPVTGTGAQKGTVTLSQNIFEPGEEISLNFTTEGNLGNSAWIGIIPSNVPHGNENKNDENDITYQYTGDKTEGVLNFVAPGDTGSYDFRLNSSDNNGAEIASVTFKVKGTPNTKMEINADKSSYARGEQMVITFKALVTWSENAWIAIVPASTKHGQATDADAVDIGYEYLGKRSKGIWKTNAPTEPGKYSIRMFDAEQGKEVKSIDFTVD